MANTHSLDLEFDSSQHAYITDGNQTGLDLSTDFSIEAWVKMEDKPSDKATISTIVAKDIGGTDRAYTLHIHSTADKPRVLFWDSSQNMTRIECDDALANAAQWYHVAVTVDISAPSASFYIDGSPASGSTTLESNSTAIDNTTAEFQIGAAGGAASPSLEHDGLIDEVRVWSDIRTANEIADNYLKQISGSSPGLVGYWRLNNDYTDETSNGNDLTAGNNPVFSEDVQELTEDAFSNYSFFM